MNVNDAIEDAMQEEINNDAANIDKANENNEEQENGIPDQDLILNNNENENEIINDEEPAQEGTNYISDESSINNDTEKNENDNDGLDDSQKMDEIIKCIR